ncbi:MAG: inorganic phosphate transporter [Bacteroidales bacterium]|nr:MAG: inorganic phosphate transporter [Bacteroidales bacterium]
MENLYIIIIGLLFILAISDLVVGVSNDAVNFLNSAIGSKAAPFRIILVIAALGIVVGATFSSGMMEVARKGIFHPDQFFFSEIIIIFLAVMLTDIILLDLFNTFGLPTSTTVSIVFELLGAAIAISIIKISHSSPEGMGDLGTYINSGKALAIISGILLSVIIAFTIGSLIQYLARIIFSFEYEKALKYFGAVWGGIAITAITYFILIKGAKGSSFITEGTLEWIMTHTGTIILCSFIGWTILLQLISWLFKFNVLRFIVLVGTFALAMAFAGNDLVNFIGVPLAGFESFKAFTASGITDAGQYSMEALQAKVQTPTSFLLIAGLIMVGALWFSKKARSVTKTEIDLARQDVGSERFNSSGLARSLVRAAVNTSNFLKIILPDAFLKAINKRFDRSSYEKRKIEQSISFDLVRATVNLTVASILIAIGTSLKLPLSTTYVTFMVAMGTSLADRAWGRESGVYRISGVITVIGGWFFTALSAFTLSFLAALVIHWLGFYGILIIVSLVLFSVLHSYRVHRKRSAKAGEEVPEKEINGEEVLVKCKENVLSVLVAASKLYFIVIDGFINEKRKSLKKARKEIKELNLRTKDLKDNVFETLKKMDEESEESGPFYVQVLDYLREAAHCLTYLTDPIYQHIDNNHPPLEETQKNDLYTLSEEITTLYSYIFDAVKKDKYDNLAEIIDQQQKILERIAKMRKRMVKFLKKEEIGTKISIVYFNTLSETKNLILHTVNIVKAQRDFIYAKFDLPQYKVP